MTTIWAQGDYPAVAKFLTSAGEAVVRAAGVTAQDTVLDVACGDGNAARIAARTGARVTGLDITPELLAVAAAAAPDVRWVHGDAEALPFADASFDVVLSVFGCMFAARHEVAARELLRVLRPGGRLVVSSWTPDGTAGQLLATVSGFVGADGVPPTLWGTEEHVRRLLGDDVAVSHGAVRFEFASAEAAMAFYETSFGPMVAARQALGPRWAELRVRIVDLFTSHAVAGDGYAYEGAYLTAQATKTGVPTSVLS